MAFFENKKLLSKAGDDFVEVDAVTSLAGKEVVLVYFSAEWCPPCRGFTPKLKDYYDELIDQDSPVAIIFVSSDRNEEAMKSYFKNKHGDWLVTLFRDELSQILKNNCEVSGIPTLALINPETGEKISGDCRNEVESNLPPLDAFKKWKALLSP